MYLGYSISNWLGVAIYGLFVLSLLTGIYFGSVKLSEFYEQEMDKKEKLSQLRHARTNRIKKVEFVYKNVV